MSRQVEYSVDPSRTSGGRYQRVTTSLEGAEGSIWIHSTDQQLGPLWLERSAQSSVAGGEEPIPAPTGRRIHP
ncbi:hypothetical protein EYF80_001337 [Liparis tanakae]|uniref:Uncharacterized protein n=1 Tax=Liparis tanakae TaxID=230148 RepID=A0A4Z2JFG1_9TELE|nr:hypothetical protein EYF80_001337 [Liparis tanakae]